MSERSNTAEPANRHDASRISRRPNVETSDGHSRPEHVSLLETIVVFSISAAIVIFVFAMSASALGDYQFRLPQFLTDSVKTLWSLVATGGLAVLGSSLDLALRRQPRQVNFIKYILGTTGLLLVPIGCLLIYGRSTQSTWIVPSGTTPINVLTNDPLKRNFNLAYLVSPAPVGFYVGGETTYKAGHVAGTAFARITRNGFSMPVPANFSATQVAIHLCYYQKQTGSQLIMIAVAPKFPEPSNVGRAVIPIPLTTDAVDVAPFPFDIEVPEIAHREAVWLCATLSDSNNQQVAAVQ